MKIYLQGAAFAALAYAMAQPAWAGDAVVANENSDAGILGQIAVTAEKRETDLQKTPIAIPVLNTQAIPEDIYEAARLDGARGLATTLRITLPLLTPSLFFLVIVSTINSLQPEP